MQLELLWCTVQRCSRASPCRLALSAAGSGFPRRAPCLEVCSVGSVVLQHLAPDSTAGTWTPRRVARGAGLVALLRALCAGLGALVQLQGVHCIRGHWAGLSTPHTCLQGTHFNWNVKGRTAVLLSVGPVLSSAWQVLSNLLLLRH